MGMLMASPGRIGKPLHPTNLHVNKSMFPHDTVQSKLPDPQWLERWLDEQIKFDQVWEQKVVTVILNNLSLLLQQPISTVQELNQYRRCLARKIAARDAIKLRAA
jgi:hypothetical protein